MFPTRADEHAGNLTDYGSCAYLYHTPTGLGDCEPRKFQAFPARRPNSTLWAEELEQSGVI